MSVLSMEGSPPPRGGWIACSEHMDKTLTNLPCKRLQVDEIRFFACAK